MSTVNWQDFPQYIANFKSSLYDSESWLVIDSSVSGLSCGGVRVLHGVTEKEVRALARAMSNKYSFFGRHMGGAKAGINLPKNYNPEQKEQLLLEFGTHFSTIIRSEIYAPWSDMNCGQNEIRHIYKGAGMEDPQIPDSAYPTALSTFHAMKAALNFIRRDIKGINVAIEGYGRVGHNLASLLDAAGAKLVAISTLQGGIYNQDGLTISEIKDLYSRFGDQIIERIPEKYRINIRELLILDVDVLIPCARPWTITDENVEQIKADIIVPSSNVPYSPEIEDLLWNQEKTLIPDFISNSGGIIATNFLDSSLSLEQIQSAVYASFEEMIIQLLLASRKKKIAPSRIASTIAYRRFKEELANYEPISGKNYLKNAAVRFKPTKKLIAKMQMERTTRQISFLRKMIRDY